MQLSARGQLILWWLFAATFAVFACSLLYPSVHLGNEFLPLGNDSFYHARRILDTAANPSAFYEFDPKIHAPEGSLLTWPWGYDYLLGWIVRIAVKLGFSGPPIEFLIWIPVAAVVIPVGLMMLIARRLSLSVWSTGLAALCVAFSPLTQGLNAVGQIDHHYAEYIFVLATIALGLRWFARPDERRGAAALGVVLGIAPAIHNGLFILQLPVLGLMVLWWLQGIQVPRRAALVFSGALLVATLAVLIPSLPFRLGRFEYYTLSWFHLYAAVGTAMACAVLSLVPRTKRNLALIAVGMAVYLAPLAHQMLMAQGFLAGTTRRLDVISEMRSIRQMAQGPDGIRFVSALYTPFLWLWPFTVGLCAYRAWVERRSERLFFWIFAIAGLTLLVMQFRLHYFGSFALVLPWLVLVEERVRRWPERRKLAMLGTSLAILLMYTFSLRYALPSFPSIAGDVDIPAMRPLLADLHDACAKDPGIVLADNDLGHYIRYFTDCSVIANNFLLTKQHADKIDLADHLLSLHAEQLPKEAPYVRYVMLRPANVYGTKKDGFHYVAYSQMSSVTLMNELLLAPVEKAPSRYVLLRQAVMRTDTTEDAEVIPLMRLYKIARPGESLSSPLPPSPLAPPSAPLRAGPLPVHDSSG